MSKTYFILTPDNKRVSTHSKRVRDALLAIEGAVETTGPGRGNWGNTNAWHAQPGKTTPHDPQTGQFTKKETSTP